MKSQTRLTRINEELLKETAGILRDLKDPRISAMTSVTKVNTTNDLKHCVINVSVMGTEEEKKSALEGLKHSAGFIRQELAHRVNLRNTPELSFKIDDSIEYGFHISKILKGMNISEAEDDSSGGSDE